LKKDKHQPPERGLAGKLNNNRMLLRINDAYDALEVAGLFEWDKI